MTLEIYYERSGKQILRHRSFCFQEFSQRYADSSLLGEKISLPELRLQDHKNRQNSIDAIDPFVKQKYEILMQQHFEQGMKLYQQMLEDDIAKECARFVLPLAVGTKMYRKSQVMDPLHKFAYCQRHPEGTHGYC